MEALLRVITGLLAESAAAAEMRAVGGVPILISMLSPDPVSGARQSHSPAVTCLVCSALTKLAIDDEGGRALPDIAAHVI